MNPAHLAWPDSGDWQRIAGEYPPPVGGVNDDTSTLAPSLAAHPSAARSTAAA